MPTDYDSQVLMHVGMTTSLLQHNMDKNWFDSMLAIDEANPTVMKSQLGINDIKSMIDECNLDYIDAMSTNMNVIYVMSDHSWIGVWEGQHE